MAQWKRARLLSCSPGFEIKYINGEVNKKQFGFVPTNWEETLTKLSTYFFTLLVKKYKQLPDLIYDENGLNDIPNPNLINVLKCYNNNHTDKKCRASKLLGIFLDKS